ncbi:mandelate racemase [Pararhizobium sp. BT-229]|nr:mandelate racemase [Pararhizobium sp. BT-229]MCV9961675.1 mandelate racemase [Pararhizobium sp. BT-229]
MASFEGQAVTGTIEIRLEEAAVFERSVRFRFPFRFGAARVEAAPQAFVRVRISDGAGRGAIGRAAEMMMPKWFDKSPALSPDDNVEQLRTSLRLAINAYSDAGGGTAFALHAAIEGEHHRRAAGQRLPGLVASYGLALIDRAIIDAVCRLEGMSAVDAVRSNRLGIDAATAPDLRDFDLNGYLASLTPAAMMAVRHTIGLADALTAADITEGARVGDGLPQTLQEVIAAYGHRHFKIKVSGRPVEDTERLIRIAEVLDLETESYVATLDGNEQFESGEIVADLLDRIAAEPRLARLRSSILFFEQPIARAEALSRSVAGISGRIPLEIDESDADIGSFVDARALGYAGISTKSCKGFYRSLLNSARTAKWNDEERTDRYFMSAEDLTTQSGLALQQDLVLAALVGATHVERNGHHYVDGMAGAPQEEQAAYLHDHGDLYHMANGRARLAIRGGRVAFASALAAKGLGSAVEPDWSAMTRS